MVNENRFVPISILYALPLRLDFPDEPTVEAWEPVCDPDWGREGGKSVGESDL